MSELIHISFAGPTVRLLVGKRSHVFEMHRYCGPIRLSPDGETPMENQWAEKSSFWPVFEKWAEQGERVDKYGKGIVD